MYQRWSERIASEAIHIGEVRGIERGKIVGKIETLMTILETFNIQCSHQEETLLKSITDIGR
jgi:hypothetical protein